MSEDPAASNEQGGGGEQQRIRELEQQLQKQQEMQIELLKRNEALQEKQLLYMQQQQEQMEQLRHEQQQQQYRQQRVAVAPDEHQHPYQQHDDASYPLPQKAMKGGMKRRTYPNQQQQGGGSSSSQIMNMMGAGRQATSREQQQQITRERQQAEALSQSIFTGGMLRPELFDERAAADKRKQMRGGSRLTSGGGNGVRFADGGGPSTEDPDATVGITDQDMEALKAMGYGIFAPGNPALQEKAKQNGNGLVAQTEQEQQEEMLKMEKELLRQRKRQGTESALREFSAGGGASPSAQISPLQGHGHGGFHDPMTTTKQQPPSLMARRVFGFEVQQLVKGFLILLALVLWNGRRMWNMVNE